MSNLIDIQAQIEKLQKQAEDIKSKEFDRTVQEIIGKMQAFGITTKHLTTAAGRGKGKGTGRAKAQKAEKPRKVRTAAKSSVAAKYRGPNGESWSGRGLTPKWMSALIAQGKTKEDFAIAA